MMDPSLNPNNRVSKLVISASGQPQSPPLVLDDLQFQDEFAEGDVLPFLLQAQDIIAKLEARVIELENDLSTINQKYENDRKEWLNGLSQKDFYIHHLSKKLHRLEFSNREAIVLLSDVQNLAMSPSTSGSGSIKDFYFKRRSSTVDLKDDFEMKVAAKITLSLNYLKNAQNSATPVDDVAVMDHDEEEYEDGELERRQAAVTTWKRKSSLASLPQSTVESILSRRTTMAKGADSVYNSDDDEDLIDDIHFRESMDDSMSSRQTDVDSFRIDSTEMSLTTAASSVTNATSPIDVDNTHPHDYFASCNGPPSINPAFNKSSPVILMNPECTSFCSTCRQLLSQLDRQVEQKAYLKRDISSLASSLAEEQELRANLEHAKELLQNDVEELVGAMFDLVNRMVTEEADAKDELYYLSREIGSGKTSCAFRRSEIRDLRFRDLKTILVDLDSAKRRSSNVSSANVNVNVGCGNPSVQNRSNPLRHVAFANGVASPKRNDHPYFSSSNARDSGSAQNIEESAFGANQRYIYIDGLLFAEFKEHIKVILSSSGPVPSVPSTLFMKRVMAEDIEPCLFQTGGSGWWKSPWFKKKLLDVISRNCCEIQMWQPNNGKSIPTEPMTLADTQAPPLSPKIKCTRCGFLRVCEFRMRLEGDGATSKGKEGSSWISSENQYNQNSKSSPWLPIDRFCRDRLVAVCEFFTFLSHLRKGLLVNSPILGMFKQCLYYRRKMQLARVGSMGLFGEEVDKGWDHTGQQIRNSVKRGNLVPDSNTGAVASVGSNGCLEMGGTIVIVH